MQVLEAGRTESHIFVSVFSANNAEPVLFSKLELSEVKVVFSFGDFYVTGCSWWLL
jgi:hypothetical protein